MDPVANKIMELLKENNGFLPLTDKSEPEEIYSLFAVSKKVFKKSLGFLYRERKVSLETNGIKLIKS